MSKLTNDLGLNPVINGNHLIEWGYKPGPHFTRLLKVANHARGWGASDEVIQAILAKEDIPIPVEKKGLNEEGIPYASFVVTNDDEATKANVEAVHAHMNVIMRLPTVVRGAVMPDACPAGTALGTIPVGGVVATKNAIHPGMHSADVCCSMMLTELGSAKPKDVLDYAQSITHFGVGGRDDQIVKLPEEFLEGFEDNPFLAGLEDVARKHFMTQGDGNHFLYVGSYIPLVQAYAGDKKTSLVTHHGSRGFGAMVYKRGMQAAIAQTRKGYNIPDHMAWIDYDTYEGRDYWAALQKVREWTKLNHLAIHSTIRQRFMHTPAVVGNTTIWNEHNFVFRREDGLFYHAKGATPSFDGFSEDDAGMSIIPMNMSEPIYIMEHRDNVEALGFAPHGAGRNMSRSAFLNNIPEENRWDHYTLDTEGIDARWFNGSPDLSECPSAYKGAKQIVAAIAEHDLAKIKVKIHPYGCIMAGEIKKDYKKRR